MFAEPSSSLPPGIDRISPDFCHPRTCSGPPAGRPSLRSRANSALTSWPRDSGVVPRTLIPVAPHICVYIYIYYLHTPLSPLPVLSSRPFNNRSIFNRRKKTIIPGLQFLHFDNADLSYVERLIKKDVYIYVYTKIRNFRVILTVAQLRSACRGD